MDCPHGDPWCPCQDGDRCHYEGEGAMTCPQTGLSPCDICQPRLTDQQAAAPPT